MAKIRVDLEENEAVLPALIQALEQQKSACAFIEQCAGTIRNPELIVHGRQGSMEREKLDGEYAVHAISGTVQRGRNGTDVRVNLSVSRSGLQRKNGQLVSGNAGKALSIRLRAVDSGLMK